MTLHGKNIPCLQCGKLIYVKPHAIGRTKFCSQKCKGLFERTEITANCAICGNLFKHIVSRAKSAKYCSRICYYKSMKNKGTIEIECQQCNSKFLTSPSKAKKRKFCSQECSQNNKLKEWNENVYHVRKYMKIRGMIKKCNRCGYDKEEKILGIHHKDRNTKNNTLKNLEVLCPNCHSIEHMKHTVQSYSAFVVRPPQSPGKRKKVSGLDREIAIDGK